MPFLRGLPLLEDLPLGLDLWLLADLRWLLSARLLWEELRLPSPRPSLRCCLSLRDFPERLLSLLRDEDVEEVVLPTLAAGCTWEESISSPRLGSPSGWTWRLDDKPDEAAFSLLFPELPFSRSLLLFFLYPRSPFPESLTLLGSFDFFRECLCPLFSLPPSSLSISSLS